MIIKSSSNILITYKGLTYNIYKNNNNSYVVQCISNILNYGSKIYNQLNMVINAILKNKI